jgi:2-C-methyl-D-erythritol 4-phosphate cytidylyltransferase
VRAGLAALPAACRIILVHDAARPFVAGETVDAVIDLAAAGVGVVPAVPVSDTLKQADAAGVGILATVPREALWRAQTPQGFPREMLEAAYGRWAGNGAGEPTDDAAVVQAAGFPVRLVRDETTNIKVTTPEDFALADALARR